MPGQIGFNLTDLTSLSCIFMLPFCSISVDMQLTKPPYEAQWRGVRLCESQRHQKPLFNSREKMITCH